MEVSRPLEGLKVVDFSRLFSAPIATTFMANCGAEVIKVESHLWPDEIRLTSPFKDDVAGLNRSAVFANVSSGKYSLSLNLNHAAGLQIARKLIARSDVVVESFRVGMMERWGLDYDELRQLKADVILLSMSMQGQTGSFKDQPGLGIYLQALAGITHFTGWPDREPAGTPIAYPDFITPWFVLVAIMAALDHRRRTGLGLRIDISQLETTLQFMAPYLLDYSVNGRVQGRMGNQHPQAAPHGVYRCRGEDRWCAVAVLNDAEWRFFVEAIGNPPWAQSPEFATVAARKENEVKLNAMVEEWTLTRTPEEVMARLQAAGVAAGVVQNGQDLLESDPQLQHRRHFCTFDHAEVGSHVVQAAPYRFSRTSSDPRWAAPCLGEHNEYVCTQILGLSDAKFVELLADGVFE